MSLNWGSMKKPCATANVMARVPTRLHNQRIVFRQCKPKLKAAKIVSLWLREQPTIGDIMNTGLQQKRVLDFIRVR